MCVAGAVAELKKGYNIFSFTRLVPQFETLPYSKIRMSNTDILSVLKHVLRKRGGGLHPLVLNLCATNLFVYILLLI